MPIHRFSVFCIKQHGGDFDAAFADACDKLGMTYTDMERAEYAKKKHGESWNEFRGDDLPDSRDSHQANAGESKSTPRVKLTQFSDIKAEPIQWLWDGHIPLGKVTLVMGDGGTNKSTIMYDLAARISRGGLAPLSENHFQVGCSLLVNGEDDPATTIKPRLDAANADGNNVLTMDIRERQRDGSFRNRAFDLDDLPSLREAMITRPEIRLIVIDPVQAFVGKKDANKGTDIYSLLSPLNQFASEHGVAVVIVHHPNKGGKGAGAGLRGRINGSGAWFDSSRAAYLVAKDKDDANKRYLICGKMNGGRIPKGLIFNIVEAPHVEAGSTIMVEWESETDKNIDELLSGPEDYRDGKKMKDAKEFLAKQRGYVPSATLFDEAAKLGIKKTTMFEAKTQMGINAIKRDGTFDGKWCWFFPTPGIVQDDNDENAEDSAVAGDCPF